MHGGLTLEHWDATWNVTTVTPGAAGLTFTTHGLTTEVPVNVVTSTRIVGFELYASTTGSGAGDVTVDPLEGHARLDSVVIGRDAWNTKVFPVAVLDDGTRALGAAPFASTSDPRLSVTSTPALDNELFLEANRAKASGDGLLTFTHAAAKTSFTVVVE